MIFNRQNYEDIKKYYGQTWVKFPKLTGDTLWFIERVGTDYLEVLSDEKEEALIDLNKGYEVDYVMPGKAVYQYGEYAAYLSRVPARMWKKGMSSANTQFRILTAAKWTPKSFDINIIKGFVNKPAYMDPYLAVAQLRKEGSLESAAISPRISINKMGSLYIDEVLIGKLDFAKNLITTREIYKSNLEVLFNNTAFKTLSST